MTGADELNRPDERKRAGYEAFTSGGPRFDGQVFVDVSSTGIYCRTVRTVPNGIEATAEAGGSRGVETVEELRGDRPVGQPRRMS